MKFKGSWLSASTTVLLLFKPTAAAFVSFSLPSSNAMGRTATATTATHRDRRTNHFRSYRRPSWVVRSSPRSSSSGNNDGDDGVKVDNSRDLFDPDELNERLLSQTNPYRAMFTKQSTKIASTASTTAPDKVYVVFLFQGAGVHSVEYPAGSGNNVILAFESKRSCENFASLLKQQRFFEPVVSAVLFSLSTPCPGRFPVSTCKK